jgi:hypothetical protein
VRKDVLCSSGLLLRFPIWYGIFFSSLHFASMSVLGDDSLLRARDFLQDCLRMSAEFRPAPASTVGYALDRPRCKSINNRLLTAPEEKMPFFDSRFAGCSSRVHREGTTLSPKVPRYLLNSGTQCGSSGSCNPPIGQPRLGFSLTSQVGAKKKATAKKAHTTPHHNKQATKVSIRRASRTRTSWKRVRQAGIALHRRQSAAGLTRYLKYCRKL